LGGSLGLSGLSVHLTVEPRRNLEPSDLSSSCRGYSSSSSSLEGTSNCPTYPRAVGVIPPPHRASMEPHHRAPMEPRTVRRNEVRAEIRSHSGSTTNRSSRRLCSSRPPPTTLSSVVRAEICPVRVHYQPVAPPPGSAVSHGDHTHGEGIDTMFIVWKSRPVKGSKKVPFLLDEFRRKHPGCDDAVTPWKPLWCGHRGAG
jgi:hypothetical protein